MVVDLCPKAGGAPSTWPQPESNITFDPATGHRHTGVESRVVEHTNLGGVAFAQHHSHYERYIPTIGGFHELIYGGGVAVGRVFYSPIIIPEVMTIDRLGCSHGGVGAGNFYLAIFDSLNEAPVNRLGVTLATLAAGINQKQQVELTVASLQLNPGYYFGAIVMDNINDTYMANVDITEFGNPNNIANGPIWYQEDLGAFLAPPAVATPVFQTARSYCIWVRVLSIP